MSNIEYKSVIVKEILQYLEDIAALRISVFREFPYLYDGTMEYEEKYLNVYSENPNSFVELAIQNSKVVGVSTGTPLFNEPEYVTKPAQNVGLKVEETFYFGESVLSREFRGQGIGWQFMKAREDYARSLNMKQAVFCAVERPADHPRRPENFFDLKEFWTKCGFQPLNTFGYFTWQDLDEDAESPKKMNYWIKLLV